MTNKISKRDYTPDGFEYRLLRKLAVKGISKIVSPTDLAEFLSRMQIQGIAKGPPLVRVQMWWVMLGRGLTSQQRKITWFELYERDNGMARMVENQVLRWLCSEHRTFSNQHLRTIVANLEIVLSEELDLSGDPPVNILTGKPLD